MSTVRDLNVEDMMLVAEVADELINNMDKESVEAIFNGKGEAKDVGLSIVKVAIRHAREPAFKLLASVNNMEIEDFKKKPASFITETVRAVINNDSNKDFFEELRSFLPTA